eukprot:7135558-Pyramimonas_sp.AAC.1
MSLPLPVVQVTALSLGIRSSPLRAFNQGEFCISVGVTFQSPSAIHGAPRDLTTRVSCTILAMLAGSSSPTLHSK